MSDRPAGSTATSDHHGDGKRGGGGDGHGDEVARQRAALDRRGGPGRTTLVAVLLALPVVDIAFIVGDAEHTRTVLLTLGVRNLPQVLVGMVLGSACFGSVLAVATSRIMFAFFAAHGALSHGRRSLRAIVGTVAISLVNPIAVGVLATCLYGWPWGLATGLLSAALRQGVVVEYRTGRRHHRSHERKDEGGLDRPARERGRERDRERGHERGDGASVPAERLSAWHLTAGRFVTVEQWLAGTLVAVVLPIAGLSAALDGRSWAPVVDCTLALPGPARHAGRLIELSRDGTGVVGWDPGLHEVLNGTDCTEAPSQTVRPAWWNE